MNKLLAPPPPANEEIVALIKRELGETPTQITTLRPGAWSSATAVSTHSGEYILRLANTPNDFCCDQMAAQFRSPHLPIPAVQGVGQLGQRWCCISTRMPGIHLDELSALEMERTLPSVAKMLTAIRGVNSSASIGYGGWDRDGNGLFPSFAGQLMDVGNDIPDARGGGWRPFLDQHDCARRVFDEGLIRLAELCTYLPDDRHLIHQDTINFNVVVHNDRISGIFDWGTAMWGDAIYDLAWFRFWNPWYPQCSELDIPGCLEREVGVIGDHPEERMRCCLLHIGLMHIRYNAFLGNLDDMSDVANATESLL